MISTLLHLLRLFLFLCGGHRQLALENLALRQQLAVYRRMVTRPKLRPTDRLFWVWVARVWTGWRTALVIVAPDSVLRWQRRRFREHWTKLSGRPTGGRPPVHAEIQARGPRMAAAHPLGGAPRIQGEGSKLGITVAERTGSPRLPTRQTTPDPSRRAFFTDHVRDRVALEFFTVPRERAGARRPRRARPPAPACGPLPGVASWPRTARRITAPARLSPATRTRPPGGPSTGRLPVVEPIPSVLRSRAKNGSP